VTSPYALLFPGQGAQSVGMGKELAQNFPAAKAIFEKADQILGFEISRLCWQGPAEALTRTEHCQPALYVTSLAALAALRSSFQPSASDFHFSAAAGLSLGEYTALAAAGALSFEEGLKLVQLRGRAMQEASAARPGTMASVLGLPLDQLEAICADTGAQVANLNSPGQIVISGSPENVKAASVLAKEKGAKRAIGLAFHSRLMQPAAERLKTALESVRIQSPKVVVMSNVTGQAHPGAEASRSLLVDQLTQPVRWESCVGTLLSMEIRTFLEVGPGAVLKGLMRKIQPQAEVISVGTAGQVEQVAQALSKA
jgi:[acyl-carrier-protein] S-malonyltransferase